MWYLEECSKSFGLGFQYRPLPGLRFPAKVKNEIRQAGVCRLTCRRNFTLT